MASPTSHFLKGRTLSRNGHEEVEKLPRLPEMDTSYWINSPNGRYEYTHSLFRFPAKLHAPVVRWALGTYARSHSLILDPFTGSGTVQVEALVRGISSVGVDIDPIACLMAKVKTTPINPKRLLKTLEKIESALSGPVGLHLTQEAEGGADISEERFAHEVDGLHIPALANITHWFRKYVIVDLAQILEAINETVASIDERDFFQACLAAIIRRVSNADPAPVSGLEVTKIQSKKNLTRKIRVFREFFLKTRKEIQGMSELWGTYRDIALKPKALILNGDLVSQLQAHPERDFSLVVTSPPYCRAVEYSRRHQLEMYWLGFVNNQQEHIALTHTYIGRKLVRESDWNEDIEFGIKRLDKTIQQVMKRDQHKGRTVRHYFYSMQQVLETLSGAVKRTGTVILVVGNSKCCTIPIPTADFVATLAQEHFQIRNRFSYALQNHSMQYGLWNGDGIKHEHVLVLKPIR